MVHSDGRVITGEFSNGYTSHQGLVLLYTRDFDLTIRWIEITDVEKLRSRSGTTVLLGEAKPKLSHVNDR